MRRRTAIRVGVIGLGRVGLATAAGLMEHGVRIEGYERSAKRRELLRRGGCPIEEAGVQSALQLGLNKGLFRVGLFPRAGSSPEILFICVDTPGAADGSVDLLQVDRVMMSLARIASSPGFSAEIAIKSTIPPGTLSRLARRYPALFRRHPVAFCPEFMREGTALDDFRNPAQTVIGVLPGAPRPQKLLLLLRTIGLRRISVVSAVSAESLKWACNAFHAVKVGFANEMGRFVTACGGDATEVMRLFRRDRRLNISTRYLRPGTPYGGSCLSKDVRALAAMSMQKGVKIPLIAASEVSNRRHLDYILAEITRLRPRSLAILGLASKEGTDDLRGSPGIELKRRIARKIECRVRAHDFLARPTGDLDRVLAGADVALVMHADPRYRAALAGRTLKVIDVAAWKGFGK